VGIVADAAVDRVSERTRDVESVDTHSGVEVWRRGWAAMPAPDMRLHLGVADIRVAKHDMPRQDLGVHALDMALLALEAGLSESW
jgi:hypothetical protein